MARGRPSRQGEPSTEVVCLRLTASEREALEKAARQNATTVAEFVRDAVNESVADCGTRPIFVIQNSPSG
jgi:uncharacterized protein (DUF1778 family)